MEEKLQQEGQDHSSWFLSAAGCLERFNLSAETEPVFGFQSLPLQLKVTAAEAFTLSLLDMQVKLTPAEFCWVSISAKSFAWLPFSRGILSTVGGLTCQDRLTPLSCDTQSSTTQHACCEGCCMNVVDMVGFLRGSADSI